MSAAESKAAPQLLVNRLCPGYLEHWRQPTAVSEIRLTPLALQQLDLAAITAALRRWLPALQVAPATAAAPAEAFGQLLLALVQALQRDAGYPVLAAAVVECRAMADHWRIRLLVPTFGIHHLAPLDAVAWLVRSLQDGVLLPAAESGLRAIAARFQRQVPRRGFTQWLLQAADAGGVPWLHVAGNVFQFGWGKRACVFDSSFTQHTGNIAARLARDKLAAAHVLRQAGVPVPRQQRVVDARHAVQVAATLGYPVVVKPVDLDGGRGVSPGLRTAEEVVRAWQRARALSAQVLVEQHVAGHDFRCYVLQGRVIHVLQRIVAGVTGDGVRNVRALLDEVNADPRRQPDQHRLQPIVLDDEANELLAEAGLGADAVPAAGRFVRLRRVPNIHSGGTPLTVELAAVHPDNIALCERAARMLRLDLCGIDLLMNDIGQSWLAGGGAICEVNAQPQMPPQLPAMLLAQLVPAQGRVPVVIIIDAEGGHGPRWWQAVEQQLQQRGTIALVCADAVRNGGSAVTPPAAISLAHAGQQVLRDPATAALLLIVSNINQLRDGLPVDSADLLVVAGAAMPTAALRTLLRALAPRAKSLWLRDDSARVLAAESASAAARVVPAAALTAAVIDVVGTML